MSIKATEKKAVERKCMGCDDDSDGSHMFKGIFANPNEDNRWEEEVYCSDCLANIVKDVPGSISHLEAI